MIKGLVDGLRRRMVWIKVEAEDGGKGKGRPPDNDFFVGEVIVIYIYILVVWSGIVWL